MLSCCCCCASVMQLCVLQLCVVQLPVLHSRLTAAATSAIDTPQTRRTRSSRHAASHRTICTCTAALTS
ncbi:hypothetical protein BC831DRAFT_469820 [Entophlyctis helioformis]|nr:hypothetical protein BC831DRAFT_469820 [Entophlyctis helioformis]